MAGSLKPITRRQKKTILGSLLVVFALVLAGFLNALSYNITFADTTITWTGTTSTDWNDASNWSEGRVPDETDAVLVATATNYPQINMTTGSVKVSQLILQSSALITVIGGSETNKLIISQN